MATAVRAGLDLPRVQASDITESRVWLQLGNLPSHCVAWY